MSEIDIRKALEKRLEANADIVANSYAIAWENVSFNPDSHDIFIRPKLDFATQRPVSIGTGAQIRHDGLFLLDVFVRQKKTQ